MDVNSEDPTSDEIDWIQIADGACTTQTPPRLPDFIIGTDMASDPLSLIEYNFTQKLQCVQDLGLLLNLACLLCRARGHTGQGIVPIHF